MTYTADQILAAQKSNVETLFGLSNKAFEGVEKLVALNLQVAKTSLAEAAETAQAALAVKDPQEYFALQASLLQPSAEKAAAYGRHFYEIVAGTNFDASVYADVTGKAGRVTLKNATAAAADHYVRVMGDSFGATPTGDYLFSLRVLP